MDRPSNEKSTASSYVHTIREELWGVVGFLAAIWGVFVLTWFVQLNGIELIPRYLVRLPGILAMPFLHRDWQHLMSNSIPLFILLTLLAGSKANSPAIVTSLVLGSGSLLWLFGRNGSPESPIAYIGASGLVFGLITFLISSGVFERRLIPLLVSVVVGLMYGVTLFMEMSFLRVILSPNDRVSWGAHFFGAVTGVLVAYIWTRESAPPLSGIGTYFRQLGARVRGLARLAK